MIQSDSEKDNGSQVTAVNYRRISASSSFILGQVKNPKPKTSEAPKFKQLQNDQVIRLSPSKIKKEFKLD